MTLQIKPSESQQPDLGAFGATVGAGITASVSGALPGSGTTSTFTGYVKGIITGVSTAASGTTSTIDVKIVSRVSSAGTETRIDYAEGDGFSSFDTTLTTVFFVNSSGVNTGNASWYNSLQLQLTGMINRL